MLTAISRRLTVRLLARAAAFGLVLVAAGECAGAERPVSFNEQIRPLLSDRCFACHGPDAKRREADLRLDTAAGAVAQRDGGAAIVPGQPDASQVLARLTATDPDERMPPADSNKASLTPAEVELVRRWIAEGAKYEGHWSLLPMKRPEPPPVPADQAGRARTPIDAFVIEKLAEHQLGSLAPDASRERLLRRVTFDLTGLPPTPAELDAFLADTANDAYERVVDRLLASPRYGERLASEWLDVARYADTHGYQADRFRPMWPYRDWVVTAFNDNLPYDQFVTWQVAGDLLPRATQQQRLATAFNRLHCQNEEGGIVEEEFRVAYNIDRVTTFGTAFLGLTFECTRCHDHKYDPLTQRDFYSLLSIFQNIDESGQTSYFTNATATPTLLLTSPDQDRQLSELAPQIVDAEAGLTSVEQAADEAFHGWLGLRGAAPGAIAGQIAGFAFDGLENNKFVNSVAAQQPGEPVDNPQLVAGRQGQAVALDGENGIRFPNLGHFHRSSPFSLAIAVKQPKPTPRAVVVHHSRAPADAASRGYDLLLEDGHVAFGLYHFWPGNAIKVRARAVLAPGAWTHVTVTYDGSSRAAGVRLYLDGRPAELETVRDHLYKDISYEGGEPELAIGNRFRDNGFRDGEVDDFALFGRDLSPLEVGELAGLGTLSAAWAVPTDALTAEQRAGLRAYFLATDYPPRREAMNRLQAARDAQQALVNPIAEAMVMQELPQPKPAFILNRGNYDQPGEAVQAGTPAALPPLANDAPRNRLGLARWLTDPEQPLLARVTVNRYWQLMFGRGLVETSDNFGSQGALPSHSDLLDWLARDFIAHGWDTKRLLRQMALSTVYRQDSRASREAHERDADNRYLGHAPVRRLTAEMLRDQALASSNLLVEKLGGPAVKPYQPAGLWEIGMTDKNYDQSHGPDLYRRSLYTYWRRTIPPPMLTTFDAADRSYCTARRQSTSTPLQPLVLLNDPQFVEAARQAGARMLREGGADRPQQAAWLFRLLTARAPSDRERQILVQLFDEQRALFAADEAAARQFVAVGETKADATLDLADLAAATVLASTLINHDEAVHVR